MIHTSVHPRNHPCRECVDDGDCDGENVCDDTSYVCVECVDDGDCGDDLVCDEAESQTCVECVEDIDCGDTKCHPDYPICIGPCCDFVVEAAGPDVKVYFRGVGVAAADDGRPVVAVADREQDRVLYMERSGGSWDTETADSGLDLYSLTAIEIDESNGAQPHMLLADQSDLVHYWREGTTWSSTVLGDVDELEGTGSFKHTDVAIDGDGTAHLMATRYSSDELYYFWRTADGTRGEETIVVEPEENIDHARMAVTSGGEPVVGVGMSDNAVRIVERTGSDAWDIESLDSEDNNQTVDIAVDADDDVLVATSQYDGAMLWQPDGSGWSKTQISSGDEKGGDVRIAVDALGDPHLVYSGSGLDAEMFYARFDGEDFEEYLIDGLQDADEYTSFDVSDDGIPHGVMRESTLEVPIRYFTAEQ